MQKTVNCTRCNTDGKVLYGSACGECRNGKVEVEGEVLVTPIVHLNGTSKAELVAMRCDAFAAIREATEALAKMGPNGRDYYLEPGRLEKAQAQHNRRMTVLRELMGELETEIDRIDAIGS